MNRRTFLATGAISLAPLAGCTDYDSDDGGEDDSDGDGQDHDNSNHEPSIRVYPALDIPEDATVLHADGDGLTDDELVRDLLESAQQEYDTEMGEEFEEHDHLELRTLLVERTITEEENRRIQDVLDRDRETGGFRWYVEYRGTTFVIWAVGSDA